LAQTESPSWYVSAGGGLSLPEGTEKSSLQHSWDNFGAGIGFNPCPALSKRFFIHVNFLFDELDVQQQALNQAKTLNPTNIGILEASKAQAKFYSTTLEPTYRFPAGDRVNVYLFAGFGWFRRSVEFTEENSGQGALLQPGGPAVFGSGGNSGAYDAGGGFDVRPFRGRLKLYWECRYLHGLAVNHETTLLLPVSAGIRW
jgi:hypothetical protein